MTKLEKRIVFFTDFSPNENGYAGPQTAYNFIKLFSEHNYIIFIESSHYKEIHPSSEWVRGKDFFIYNYFFSYTIKNRLNAVCNYVKFFFNPRFFFISRKLLTVLADFNPEIIICITNTAYIYRAGEVLKDKFPNAKLFFYIMDDYRHYNYPYLVKSFNGVFKKISGWISISDAMVSLFVSKFPSLNGKPRIIVQNPVNPERIIKKAIKRNCDKVKIVYAGSVYPNHKDVLLLVIEAINLSEINNIELSIYTKLEFRQFFKDRESEKIRYKGSYSYQALLKELPKYDYGLVSESFLPEFDNFARSSIQTKINDYILSGCLPIVIGPAYGACRKHIITNELGYSFSVNNSADILYFLMGLIQDNNYISKLKSAQLHLKNSLNNLKADISSFIE